MEDAQIFNERKVPWLRERERAAKSSRNSYLAQKNFSQKDFVCILELIIRKNALGFSFCLFNLNFIPVIFLLEKRKESKLSQQITAHKHENRKKFNTAEH